MKIKRQERKSNTKGAERGQAGKLQGFRVKKPSGRRAAKVLTRIILVR